MSKTSMTTVFLKECMADSLIRLMAQKNISKITVEEIVAGAGVNRSTWFRNFSTKNEALYFKLIMLWNKWVEDNKVPERQHLSLRHVPDFFKFNYEIKDFLKILSSAGLDPIIFEAFSEIMMSMYGTTPKERYQVRFFSHGLFGLLEEWIKRDFAESPQEMSDIFYKYCAAAWEA
ncbi:MAG: TetR/AcrR family transcriptional regulator [Lachnospiraceae bacterium]|nr:TetR/AcrR family transcriptional regulator [Lachnospiraceae bacterium]